jgi:hypothetical protein
VFGLAAATGVFAPNTVTVLTISGNRFTGNGVRPNADYPGQSTHFEWRGAGIHLVRRAAGGIPGSTFIGTIATNTITGNRTGIAYSGEGSGVGTAADLTIAGNVITGQVLFPPGYVPTPGSPNQPYGDGVGIIVGDDPIPGLVFGGTIASTFFLESNCIFGNQRHGVWIAAWNAGSSISPTLRNNRIYGNGTVLSPTPMFGMMAPPTSHDGVRIENPNAVVSAFVGPTLVVETIVNHANGYGVNNVVIVVPPPINFVYGQPRLWSSIVYGNNGPVVGVQFPNWGGPDLFGFDFGMGNPAVGGPTVDYSDFCGFPWDPVMEPCGSGPLGGPNAAGCITSPPTFVAPAAPNFIPTCAPTGTTPPNCACTAPPAGSACIDAGNDAGPADSSGNSLMPVRDPNGTLRIVNLYADPTPIGGDVDMGAVEKQTCIP